MRCVDNKAEPAVVAIIPGGGRPKRLAMKRFAAFFFSFLMSLFFFSVCHCTHCHVTTTRTSTKQDVFYSLTCFYSKQQQQQIRSFFFLFFQFFFSSSDASCYGWWQRHSHGSCLEQLNTAEFFFSLFLYTFVYMYLWGGGEERERGEQSKAKALAVTPDRSLRPCTAPTSPFFSNGKPREPQEPHTETHTGYRKRIFSISLSKVCWALSLYAHTDTIKTRVLPHNVGAMLLQNECTTCWVTNRKGGASSFPFLSWRLHFAHTPQRPFSSRNVVCTSSTTNDRWHTHTRYARTPASCNRLVGTDWWRLPSSPPFSIRSNGEGRFWAAPPSGKLAN